MGTSAEGPPPVIVRSEDARIFDDRGRDVVAACPLGMREGR